MFPAVILSEFPSRENRSHDPDHPFAALVHRSIVHPFALSSPLKKCYSSGVNSRCEFIKPDRQRCKHSVAVGERLCWQHAKGWRSKLRSLPKNARVIFAIGIVSLAVTCYGVWLELFPHAKPSSVHIETSGDKSPVVQDNQGSVTFNDSQSEQPKKKTKDTGKPNAAEGKK